MQRNIQKLPPGILSTLEALRGMSQQSSRKEVVKPTLENVIKPRSERDLKPGESLTISELRGREVVTTENNRGERHSYLLEEERLYVDRKTRELNEQIRLLQEEVSKLAVITTEADEGVKVAASNATNQRERYDNFAVVILKDLVDLFKAIIKDVQAERSSFWLLSYTQRSNRRGNLFGKRIKEQGTSYLMSSEHYNGRSAA